MRGDSDRVGNPCQAGTLFLGRPRHRGLRIRGCPGHRSTGLLHYPRAFVTIHSPYNTLQSNIPACSPGGTEILVEGENALIAPVGDTEALAQAMHRLLTDTP